MSVLYADDTSMIVTGSSPVQFSTELSTAFDDTDEWIRLNLMYLNYEKTHYLQFQTKNSQKLDLDITLADFVFIGYTIRNQN
jgi:hypothetical protein